MQRGFTNAFKGVRSSEAIRFTDALNDAWMKHWRLTIEEHSDSMFNLAVAINGINQTRNFPAACLVEPNWQKAKEITEWLPMDLSSPIYTSKVRTDLEKIVKFYSEPSAFRDKAIERFLYTELKDTGLFFKTIQEYPLTQEQRLAIISDEDATLVLAGAGSGKTAVLTAKAAYLIRRGIRKPEEVLMMAFGNAASKEMSSRIKKCCNAEVATMTFHKLAYDIIGEVEGEKPLLADFASDEKSFHVLIQEILFDLVERDEEFNHILRLWFTEFSAPAKSHWHFQTLHEYYEYVERCELRTFQGERVRSFEELMIANWLFQNSISYEYEPEYEHPLLKSGHKSYTPDFRLIDSGVYIEHYGVRWSQAKNGHKFLATAPYIDREKYLEQMEWQRKTHAEFGTTLIETFSYENVEGCLLSSLEENLTPYIQRNHCQCLRSFLN